MRVFNITANGKGVTETDALPSEIPPQGFVWIACARREFEVLQAQIQAGLQSLCGTQLVDLHVSDLLNNQLPSHYDYTSQYDILVFRRLATGHTETDPAAPGQSLHQRTKRSGPPVLRHIDTSPVGFAVFDQVLLTVHPTDCAVREAYALKLLNATNLESRANGVKLPASPADLMLRIVSHMVDGYLELRRELTRQLDHWQHELLKPGSRFSNWTSVLDARLAMHQLDEICEDQRSAVQDWIDSVETWPEGETPGAQRERELLKIRSRDVLEHIERVVHHVRRMEQSAETAVQMHFSAQSNRTNDIMRTLTALTAVFLPLNLITGFFGMNFEFMPVIHSISGFWWTLGFMVTLVLVVVVVFWRKRYLAKSSR
ncbi:MAG: magnesium transporter CorA family protein [Polaromonas sp.]|uniref:magnesium transporter CorA family protein n=1 Tax=Polaromonas sp. TaxID=1869339 RepID=UPI002730DA04|nr:magnesium transporter CorA family protein [Polaromonas sp.]MDP2256280.1 magnesium transporter CorA family protein [Polaromonas sp.]MDP3706630.1 magnesium transporter CorA family protein [Polaromonas sp.]